MTMQLLKSFKGLIVLDVATRNFGIMMMSRCSIPWCLLHYTPKQSDIKFLKINLKQKHSTKERIKIALSLGCPNYVDENSHLDYLTSQGIVGS